MTEILIYLYKKHFLNNSKYILSIVSFRTEFVPYPLIGVYHILLYEGALFEGVLFNFINFGLFLFKSKLFNEVT